MGKNLLKAKITTVHKSFKVSYYTNPGRRSKLKGSETWFWAKWSFWSILTNETAGRFSPPAVRARSLCHQIWNQNFSCSSQASLKQKELQDYSNFILYYTSYCEKCFLLELLNNTTDPLTFYQQCNCWSMDHKMSVGGGVVSICLLGKFSENVVSDEEVWCKISPGKI